MICEALGNFQITPNLTENGIRKFPRAKFAASFDSKPFVRWVITVLVVVVLLMQTNQVLANPEDYTRWGLPEGAKARIGKGTFTDMQLSTDGTRLAIASSAGVWLYDVRTGDEIALITENAALIGLVAFSSDGTMLATAGGDNECRIWDVESQKLLLTFKLPNYWINRLTFLDDGKTLVGEGEIDKSSHPLMGGGPWRWDIPKVWMWDVSSGKQLDTFTTRLPRFNPFKDAHTNVRVKAFANGTRLSLPLRTETERLVLKMDARIAR